MKTNKNTPKEDFPDINRISLNSSKIDEVSTLEDNWKNEAVDDQSPYILDSLVYHASKGNYSFTVGSLPSCTIYFSSNTTPRTHVFASFSVNGIPLHIGWESNTFKLLKTFGTSLRLERAITFTGKVCSPSMTKGFEEREVLLSYGSTQLKICTHAFISSGTITILITSFKWRGDDSKYVCLNLFKEAMHSNVTTKTIYSIRTKNLHKDTRYSDDPLDEGLTRKYDL
jgi:hypothetical protein